MPAVPLVTLRRLPNGRTQWEYAPLELRALPGRGIGAMAARDFASGERILAEAPLVAWDSGGESTWSELARKVDALP